MSDSRKPASTRFASTIVDRQMLEGNEHAAAIIGNKARSLARDLLGRGPIGSAGIIVSIESKDLVDELEPFNSPVDPEAMAPRQLETGHVRDIQGTPRSYECGCGWSTENVLELVEHLEAHGVRRVVVSPAMGRRR